MVTEVMSNVYFGMDYEMDGGNPINRMLTVEQLVWINFKRISPMWCEELDMVWKEKPSLW